MEPAGFRIITSLKVVITSNSKVVITNIKVVITILLLNFFFTHGPNRTSYYAYRVRKVLIKNFSNNSHCLYFSD